MPAAPAVAAPPSASASLALTASASTELGATPAGATTPSPLASGAAPVPAPSGPTAPVRDPTYNDGSPPAGGGTYHTSVRYKTWIWRQPIKGGKYFGTMRVGQRVALASTEKVRGQGCARGFYRIEPMGYVCDDATVTLDTTSPFIVANAHTIPFAGAFPYRWALSSGAPMYARLPTRDEQIRHERFQYGPVGVHPPLSKFQRGHEHLAVAEVASPTDDVPRFLEVGRGARGPVLEVFRRTLPHGSMFAFTEAFEHDGRTYLLSADLTVVPADRVRPFRPSRFAGVSLGPGGETAQGGAGRLPGAWIRGEPKPRYDLRGDAVTVTGSIPVRSWVDLSGDRRTVAGVEYLALARGGWVAAADATVVEHYGKYPYGVPEGAKWLIVSITAGTLVAYDGQRPVFTTLVSPGQGGLPVKGRDPVEDSTTPMGSFKITYKDRAATMAPEFGESRGFWIADVPFTMYFQPPFALHGAYWHERFGEPMSAGCVNVSPLDGAFLFEWTDPPVPPGWQGIVGNAYRQAEHEDERGLGPPATWVVVGP